MAIVYSDVDKDPSIALNYTCWLATASNMLACAGYSNNNGSVIYTRLISNAPTIAAKKTFSIPLIQNIWKKFVTGYSVGGYVYDALKFYVNTYPEKNLFSTVRSFGNIDNSPLSDKNLVTVLSNCIDKKYMVSLALGHYDFVNRYILSSTHAVTLWKIEISDKIIITLTDSDYDDPLVKDKNADLNIYELTFDNKINGWFINYQHSTLMPRFIGSITILSDSGIGEIIPESLLKTELFNKDETSCCSF